ncbi:hypothetical protein Pyn_00857 [Prunus yedoensis var. nudiflora]|uniref:Uncharacterized protein n=1 Tax=Prunus yedoensis var. nudiflora TaxID=2094558 RepID=A0A314Z1H0_PRUYE|nr:hypothetical protein Pyn_00857 [Prunus yedoensis var. nudiflora]
MGIGGAERLIVDVAVELVSHEVHHDKNRCFEETVSGVCAFCCSLCAGPVAII